jgi:molecular chaperone HscA
MSLLQISEPGESTPKQACAVRAVGIDLGTTNSLVAHVDDGDPAVLPVDGELLLPSVVHYGDGRPVVGRAARDKLAEAPEITIASAKRFVGRSAVEIRGSDEVTRHVLAESDDSERLVRFDLGGGRSVTPVEVSADILRMLKASAEADLGGPVDAAVITVPAYFDDAQRQATRDAGRLAGLEVLRLLAEPTAAALAYGLDRGSRGVFAVYDLGGGTFDISILELTRGVFRVRATGGDSALGGDDFDRALAAHMVSETAGGDLAGLDSRALSRALVEARRVKEALTGADSVSWELDGRIGSIDRAGFAALIKSLLDRTGAACRRALKDAGIRARELDGVILVGGSTRAPAVSEYVAEIFGREPLSDIDPDQVVALGAASQAHLLSGGSSDVLLLDVLPLSLGIETMGGIVEKIIARNSTIPVRASQTFTTYADNQTGFDIHVVQGERETVDACRSLARFVLGGIPPMIAGAGRVEISFAVDADGLLTVTARELTTGKQTRVEVKPTYGLTDEEVETMLIDSYEHAEEDLAERNLRSERVEAERILAATRRAMVDDAALLTDDVRAATDEAMAKLELAMAGDDHLAIRKAIEALDHASKPFAQERMNRAVAAAAVGRDVDEVDRSL